jgi:hypothetical protein
LIHPPSHHHRFIQHVAQRKPNENDAFQRVPYLLPTRCNFGLLSNSAYGSRNLRKHIVLVNHGRGKFGHIRPTKKMHSTIPISEKLSSLFSMHKNVCR